jgi:outer membrane protein assembly factor BamD (BamD/ComL family)
VIPDFKPTSSEVRFTLAQDYASFGDYPAVVRLINGMHQECSDNQLLIKAYSLMHEALEALNKEEMAVRCQKLLNRLESQAV